MMRLKRRKNTLILPGFLIVAPALAQQSELPRLSVTTRLVQVSVVVHGKNGRPVNDLTQDDFVVLDNGKPQTITGFFRSAGEPPAPAAVPARRAPDAPRTWSNRGQSDSEMPRTVTALVIDGLNTNLRDQAFVKEKMLAFLRKLREGDSAALYLISTDLRILHDFTDDAGALIRALEGHEPKMLMQWQREDSPATMRGRLKQDRASFTLSALRAIGQHLSRIPGRKNLVWVTSGFPMLIYETEEGRLQYLHSMVPEMQAAAKAIGDADVALYPVSAMGLVGMPQMSAAQASTARNLGRGSTATGPQIVHSSQAGPIHDMMNSMAAQTGGRAFYERNDLDTALRQAMTDLSATYTLAFKPSHDQWNGEYRVLRVQLKRKGLQARHRPGYVAAPDGPADTRDADSVLADAIGNPLDSTGVGLTVGSQGIDASGAKLRIRIDVPTITLEPVQDRWKGELLLAVVPQADGDAASQPQVQRVGIDLSHERYDEAMKEGAILTQSISQDDCSRGVRVFVLDIASRRVGSVNVR